MFNENPSVEVLEETHALKILLVLLREGRMIKGVLNQKITRSTVSVQRRIDALVRAGLLSEEQEEQHPFRKYIELTPRGRAVAEHLQAIEEILQKEA